MMDDTEGSWVLPCSANESSKSEVDKNSLDSLEQWIETDALPTKLEEAFRNLRASDLNEETEGVTTAEQLEAIQGDEMEDWTETSSSHESIYSSTRVHPANEIKVDDTSDLSTIVARGWPLFVAHNLDTSTDLQSILAIVETFDVEVHRTHFPLLLNETKRLMRIYDGKSICFWTNLQDPIRCMALKEISFEEIKDKFGRAKTLPEWKPFLEWDDTEMNRSKISKQYNDEKIKKLTRETLKFVDMLLKKTREVDTWSKIVACAENATCDYLWAQSGYLPAPASGGHQ